MKCIRHTLLAAAPLFAASPVDVPLTRQVSKYCHIVQFPDGWKVPPVDVKIGLPEYYYGYDSLYEFRELDHSESTFLVAGVVSPYMKYTLNKYKLDLSVRGRAPIRADEAEWRSSKPVADARANDWQIFGNIRLDSKDVPLPYKGRQFFKTGKFWEGNHARLSPGGSWLVLLSSSGRVAKRNEFFNIAGRDKGKLYYDVFRAESGEKIITIVGRYKDIEPGHAINQSIWVTDRYFLIPLSEHRERCLVCEFGASVRKGISQ